MKMKLVQRVLNGVCAAQMRHPALILFLALCLAALSIFYAVRNLEFQTGQTDLISKNERLIRLSKEIKPFDQLDTFIVAIENHDQARSLKFLNTLVPLLEADRDNYVQVFSRVDPGRFKSWALLYLDTKDLSALQENLRAHRSFLKNFTDSPGLVNLLREIDREMASAMIEEVFTGFLDEEKTDRGESPLNFDLLLGLIGNMKAWLDGDTSRADPWSTFFIPKSAGNASEEGYFWTENKRYLLVFVTPKNREGTFSDALQALGTLRGVVSSLKSDFPDVNAGVTGMEALNADEMGVAFKDMSLATAISLLGLALLLFFSWRGVRRPIMGLTGIVIPLSWTFGLTTLFIGHLNLLSITFAPLLLGLGIDYDIHWFARYQEEEQLNHGPQKEVLRKIMLKLGPSIVLAGFTAALSFFPLVLTGFKGLMELGVITSMGMALSTVNTICVVPAMITVFDRYAPGEPLPSFSWGSLRFGRARAFGILIFAGVALALSLRGTAGVAFDLNILHLQSKKSESVVWEKKLLEDSQRSSMYGAILAKSLEDVDEKMRTLRSLPTVSEVLSIKSMLPDHQEEKIRILREMGPLIEGIEQLATPEGSVNVQDLKGVLEKIRSKMSAALQAETGSARSQIMEVRDLIDQLREYFSRMEVSSFRDRLREFEKSLIADLNEKLDIFRSNVNAIPMKVSDLPGPLLQRYVSGDNRYLLRVFPSVDIWNPDSLGSFVHDLRSVDPDAIGDPVTLYIFTKSFRDASIKAAVYAALFIFIVLWLTFRNLLSAVVVITPLFVGTAWTVGLMRLFDVNFNLANSIFLPLVVGAGVEYGIIIMHRWLQQRSDGDGDVALPLSTVKGVILAGLTTTIGFGSLTISSHQGIFSLGFLAMVGSLCILSASILFLPALLQVLPRFSGK